MFKPVNRHITVSIEENVEPATTSGILLPEDFKPTEERFVVANVINWAEDVRFKDDLSPNTQVVIDKSMVEEITVQNQRLTVILDNYVVGII
jgi:co-chaperonin GroES (HSP10)